MMANQTRGADVTFEIRNGDVTITDHYELERLRARIAELEGECALFKRNAIRLPMPNKPAEAIQLLEMARVVLNDELGDDAEVKYQMLGLLSGLVEVYKGW